MVAAATGRASFSGGSSKPLGGLYHQALGQERVPALDRFAADAAQLYETPPPLSFATWDQALRHAIELLGTKTRGGPQLLVIDEYPYLRRTSPELDSTLQSIIDDVSGGDLRL
jgi:hypothetical protein